MRNTLFEFAYSLMNEEQRARIDEQAQVYFRAIGTTFSIFVQDGALLERLEVSHSKHVKAGSVVTIGQSRYPVQEVTVTEEVVELEGGCKVINRVETYKVGSKL